MKKLAQLLLTLLLFLAPKIFAQDSDIVDFYRQIKNYDISEILMCNSFLAEDSEDTKEKIERPEPIGFIGDDYQRFYIHFQSITQNPNNKYEYFANGKTKVKDNIRSFKGTITIKKAVIGKNEDFPDYQQGHAICEVKLYEDKKLTATGIFQGEISVGFVIDKNKKFRYDGLMFYANGFSNNDFQGKWTSYKTGKSKTCNFGDFRIPNSGDLDIGAGEFSPDPKFFDKGWKYYILKRFGETEIDYELGKKKEAEKWLK